MIKSIAVASVTAFLTWQLSWGVRFLEAGRSGLVEHGVWYFSPWAECDMFKTTLSFPCVMPDTPELPVPALPARGRATEPAFAVLAYDLQDTRLALRAHQLAFKSYARKFKDDEAALTVTNDVVGLTSDLREHYTTLYETLIRVSSELAHRCEMIRHRTVPKVLAVFRRQRHNGEYLEELTELERQIGLIDASLEQIPPLIEHAELLTDTTEEALLRDLDELEAIQSEYWAAYLPIGNRPPLREALLSMETLHTRIRSASQQLAATRFYYVDVHQALERFLRSNDADLFFGRIALFPDLMEEYAEELALHFGDLLAALSALQEASQRVVAIATAPTE